MLPHELGDELVAVEIKNEHSIGVLHRHSLEGFAIEAGTQRRAKHWRFADISWSLSNEVNAKELGVTAEEELMCFAPAIEFYDDCAQVRLANTLHFCAFEGLDLVRNGGEAEGVEGEHAPCLEFNATEDVLSD